VFWLEVVLSVSFYDHVLFLDTRCLSVLHIVNVHESDLLTDPLLGSEMDIGGTDFRKEKYRILQKKICI
jgi:hypothetical protein